MHIRLFLAAATLIVSTSCGTMVYGSTTEITIISPNSGEVVAVDGVLHETPVTLEMDVERPHWVHTSDGETYEILPIPNETAGLMDIAWILTPPIALVAIITDGMTGALLILSPEDVHIKERR